jgi:hypothetical protein
MSIVNEVRSRTEGALAQGKQVLDSAQTRLVEAVGTVSSVAEKTAHDVSVAGRSVNFETLIAELEHLVKLYRDSANDRVADLKADERITKLVDRAESVINELKADKRVTQLVERAETLYEALYETVQTRVVKPTKDLIAKTPMGASAPAAKPRAAKAPAAAAPAKKAPAKKAPAETAPAAAAKETTTAPAKKAAAKKVPAKKAASTD